MYGAGAQLTSLRAIVTIQDINASSLVCEHKVLGGVDIDNIDEFLLEGKKEEGGTKGVYFHCSGVLMTGLLFL